MSEITIHTGCAGDRFTINIQWFDENNVQKLDKLVISVRDKDKPRLIDLIVNDVVFATLLGKDRV